MIIVEFVGRILLSTLFLVDELIDGLLFNVVLQLTIINNTINR